MLFRQITDERLSQYAYLIGCEETGDAIVIDPERDIDRYVDAARLHDLTITAVAETHIHADFLSGAREFAETYGVRVYLSDAGDDEWRYEWAADSGYDCRFLHDEDTFSVGKIEFRAVHTPGHTPEHLSFAVVDHGAGVDEAMGLVTGDFVFVLDLGRPDLLESAAGNVGAMEPSARRLHESARWFLQQTDHLQVWPGHGAGSACGKSLGAIPQSTVGYEKRFNTSLKKAREDEETFVRDILSGQTSPPLYFARMKQWNKEGPPLLRSLPEPRRVRPEEASELDRGAVLLDTRIDRTQFMRRHVPGSLLAPFDKTFPTVVGSLLADPESEIYLVIDSRDVSEAVRSLVRIGYDHVKGFVDLSDLEAYFDDAGDVERIEAIDFDRADARREEGEQIVDVRFKTEYDRGHLPGAVLAPYTRLPEHLDDIPRGKTLVVHCSTGIRSAVAAAFLRREGWKVRYVKDDFAEWARSHEAKLAEGSPA